MNFSVLLNINSNLRLNCIVRKQNDLIAFFDSAIIVVPNFQTPSSTYFLNTDAIGELSDLENIEQVEVDNAFVVLKKIKTTETVNEAPVTKYTYQVYRSSGFDIVGVNYKRISLKSSLLKVWENTYNEDHDIKLISVTSTEIVIFDRTDGVVISYKNQIVSQLSSREGTTAKVSKLGVVSYNSAELDIPGKELTDVTVEYISADPLESLSEENYPVMKDIIWK